MCGIAGLIGPIDAGEAGGRLGAMLRCIGYRGPDECTGVAQPGFALGTVRLSIVDLMTGAQPAISDDGRIYVVFNGEIFNFRDLRAGLEVKGHRFRSNSEVEVLLHLYQEYGLSMAEKLNGQFAIAIWDSNAETLHLVRDPFGIRPLFWWSRGSEIIFASEVKAILTNPQVSLTLDLKALCQTLRFWTCVGTRSAFAEVSQVAAGCAMSWRRGKHTLTRYWQWPLPGTVAPLKLPSDEDYFELFREELARSVVRQTMADVEVGAYVSGGIDSSILLHNFHAMAPESQRSTFSVAFDDPAFDESEAQSRVVDHYRTRHSVTRICTSDIGADFATAVLHAETPLFRSAPVAMYHLSRAVRQRGIKVVLSGEGADEVLLGYDLFREAKVRRFWARQPDSRCRGHLMSRLYDYLPQYRSRRYANLLLDFYRPTLGQVDDRHYAMAVRWGNGKVLEQCFGPAVMESLGDYDPVSDLDPWLPTEFDSANIVERAQAVEVATLLSNYLLSSQGDRMALANSVETRYPYLDLEFVRFAARLPQSIKLRGLKDKFILRQSYAGQIPDAIRERKKFAYQAPDKKAFFRDGGLFGVAADMLTPERIRQDGYFDSDYVNRYCLTPPTSDSGRQGFRSNMLFLVVLSTTLLNEYFVRSRGAAAPSAAAPPLRLVAPTGGIG